MVELKYFVFTRIPGESYIGRVRALLLCVLDDFQAVIISLVRWFFTFMCLISMEKGFMYEKCFD